MSTPDQPAQKKNNNMRVGIILGIVLLCLCLLTIGAVGGGIVLTNSWATATKQEQYVRETATKQAAYVRATATKHEEYVRATATKQEQFAQATATQQEFYAQATALADTIFGMIPEGIAARFPQVVFYEPFDSAGAWTVGRSNTPYWTGEKTISNRYIWTINTIKGDFISWEYLPSVRTGKDFYYQADVTLTEGPPSDSCYGISFHHTSDDNFYALVVCEQSYYIGYFKGDEWTTIRDWDRDSSINKSGMNQLGVSAEDENYEIYINSEMIYSFTDDSLQLGRCSFFIEKFDQSFTKFEFDNFIVLEK